MVLAYPHIQQILQTHPKDRCVIVSDSRYAIGYATTTGQRHHKQGWTTAIPNKSLVRRLYQLYSVEPRVTFRHIMAHTGKSDVHSRGNEEADRLANEGVGVGGV